MTDEDDVTDGYRTQLRNAVEDSATREMEWTTFHTRLAEAVAPRLDELRRRTSGGYRATAAVGAAGFAWWDYAARAALAAVPLGLAAALLLLTYLRSGSGSANDARPAVSAPAVASGSADSARAAFESVLTGAAAPQAVMATLIPVPAAAFLAESAGGSGR
jgi:hypothetical protein